MAKDNHKYCPGCGASRPLVKGRCTKCGYDPVLVAKRRKADAARAEAAAEPVETAEE